MIADHKLSYRSLPAASQRPEILQERKARGAMGCRESRYRHDRDLLRNAGAKQTGRTDRPAGMIIRLVTGRLSNGDFSRRAALRLAATI